MELNERRRPIRARGARLTHQAAQWLSNTTISPNQISVTSVVAATLAAGCLVTLPYATGMGKWLLPLLAAFFIEFRLICNLLDGLVAVEGGKATPAGEILNELPDRIADPLILVACGYAIIVVGWADTLGWFASLLAIMTAYVRMLAVNIGAPMDFSGPMSKPQRMHLLAVACILTAFEPLVWSQGYVLLVSLLLVTVGTAVTVFRRTRNAYLFLERNNDG